MTYNLFVDESCHLERDRIPVMCVGYIKDPAIKHDVLTSEFTKLKFGYKALEEIKWNKFSKSRLPFYKALVDLFFHCPLEFRCVLIKYKDRLKHEDYNQGSHDNYYYKMIYQLLRPNPVGAQYRVFLDIKDHHGREKLKKMREIFDNTHKGESPYVHFQHLRSHDNVLFGLTDLFIGAIAYKARCELKAITPNAARMAFINYLEEKAGFLLHESTPVWENKFNIFDHQPKKG